MYFLCVSIPNWNFAAAAIEFAPRCAWRDSRGGCPYASCSYAKLAFVQENAFGFLGVYWTIVEFVGLQEDLDKGRPGGDGALDQRL